MNKYIGHFKTIVGHKWRVFRACCIAGIPVNGIFHDMSKLSPVEFFESAKYFTGTSSPINGAKKDKGYSDSWFHHRGRNKHHWEFWVDELSKGGIPVLMPYKYAVEYLCDLIGAGQSYEKDTWNFSRPYEWFQGYKKRENPKLHPIMIDFVDTIFLQMKEFGYEALKSYNTKAVYELCVLQYRVENV